MTIKRACQLQHSITAGVFFWLFLRATKNQRRRQEWSE